MTGSTSIEFIDVTASDMKTSARITGGGWWGFPLHYPSFSWHYNSSTYGIPHLKMGSALKKYPISIPIPPPLLF